nr:HTTM domain-containing protein [Sphingobacterium sp. N143]
MLIPVLLFDKRKNHWEFEAPSAGVRNIIPIITITVIRLQVTLIYFHASVGKYAVPEWTNGTAIYYWWNNTVFGMPLAFSVPINSLLSMPLVVSVLTYSVLIFEIVVFLALTGSIRYRKNLLPFAILFHLLIILMHGIFSFFFAISMALILFLQPANVPFKFNFLQLCQKKIKYLFSLSILILLFSGFLLLQNYTQISQQVVTHVNISGEADKFGDKIKEDLLKATFFLRGVLECPYCKRKKYPYYHCQGKCKTRINTLFLNDCYQREIQQLVLSDKVADLFNLILKDWNTSTNRTVYLSNRNLVIRKLKEQESLLSQARKLFVIGGTEA